MRSTARALACVGLAALLSIPLSAGERPSAERGKEALYTRHFSPAPWSVAAYENAWKHWQPAPEEAPGDYDAAFRAYYGLHPAPYANGRYPMGLRETKALLGRGVTSDCLLCHGGSIMGKSHVGLGNTSIDIHSLFSDLNQASGRSAKLPFTFSNARGTTEAAGFAIFLWSYREPDLKIRFTPHKFDLRDDQCEDTPAWWLLKKKKTMYFTGTADARSVRSIMQFMLSPTNSAAVFEKEEATFADIQAYLLSLEAPKYPFPVDARLADVGRGLFNEHCSQCHGTYGDKPSYPNRVVSLDVVGTDRARFEGIPHAVGELYNQSWFAKEKGEGYAVTEPKGYQAPPLDGVWATAPYFHNGSVPTLYNVLSSKSRPRIFTRSYRTDAEAYDTTKVGWKVQTLDHAPGDDVPGHERRKVYDTTGRGRGNMGHTFGDAFSEDERRAVVEYLKTL